MTARDSKDGVDAADDADAGFEKLLPDCRFAVRGFACGLLLAWVLVSMLKYMDLMPDHVTWAKGIIGPAIFFTMIGGPFAAVLWLRSRWWMVYLPP